MTTVNELSEGTVADVKKELPALTDEQLRELHDLEEGKDDPRSTLLDAIHVEMDQRKSEAPGEPLDDRAARFATMTANPEDL